MADRIGQLEGQFVPASSEATGAGEPRAATHARAPNPKDEAEAALIALGYKPQEAAKAISKVAEDGMTSEALIRLALRNMIPA